MRNLVAKMATHSNWFNSCCKKATVIFVTTEETKKLIPCKYSEKVVVNQAISISADEISLKVSDRKNHEPLKVLMAGRSLYYTVSAGADCGGSTAGGVDDAGGTALSTMVPKMSGCRIFSS